MYVNLKAVTAGQSLQGLTKLVGTVRFILPRSQKAVTGEQGLHAGEIAVVYRHEDDPVYHDFCG